MKEICGQKSIVDKYKVKVRGMKKCEKIKTEIHVEGKIAKKSVNMRLAKLLLLEKSKNSSVK